MQKAAISRIKVATRIPIEIAGLIIIVLVALRVVAVENAAIPERSTAYTFLR